MAILELGGVGGRGQFSAVACGESVVQPIFVEEGLAEKANGWGIDIRIDHVRKAEIAGLGVELHLGWNALCPLHV